MRDNEEQYLVVGREDSTSYFETLTLEDANDLRSPGLDVIPLRLALAGPLMLRTLEQLNTSMAYEQSPKGVSGLLAKALKAARRKDA